MPEITPVDVLNDRPAGSVGLIAKLAIAPPVGVTAGPVKAVPTIAVPDDEARVNVGFASFAVSEYVSGDVPEELVAVIV